MGTVIRILTSRLSLVREETVMEMELELVLPTLFSEELPATTTKVKKKKKNVT